LVILGILFVGGCQYDYTSPLPGTIDVKLRVISNNIAFDPLNNFVLKVTSVEAVRTSDKARAPIYEDTKAIGRTTNVYNTLDFRARDSSLVMGEGYLPPAGYDGVNLLIEPGASVILDGYRTIPVYPAPDFNPLLSFRSAFGITEQKTTSIIVTIDLDKSLFQQSNSYLFQPVYYISSIK
jgi:hypothetical protein